MPVDNKNNPGEGEIEQLRVAAESARDEVAALAVERDNLLAELQRRNREFYELRARFEESRADPGRQEDADGFLLARNAEQAANEELRVALEEVQVLAEELHEANAALMRANQNLEHRVAARTAELEALNHKLRDSESWLRFALGHSGAGIWDWHLGSRRLAWSDECFALHGMPRGSGAPRFALWLSTVDPADRGAARRALRKAIARCEQDGRIEYRVNDPGRGERWLMLRFKVLSRIDGRPERLTGICLDITDRKRAEIALAEVNAKLREEVEEEVQAREAVQARLFQNQKLEAIGQLTGGVAHDFNNLLSVILSSAALLRRSTEPERRERLLNTLEQTAHRGATLTQRLLSFSRRQALKPEPIDISHWLDDARELLARSLREDIVVETDAPGTVWPVLADRAELELAVLNLAVNARDAMPKGGILTLTLRNSFIGEGDPDGLAGAFVRLSVSDTGTGMPPEVMQRAFDPFFTTKEAGRGTGLGLPQVYGFARQSGGTARIDSRPGRGTTVTILLPRAQSAPATLEPAMTTPRNEPKPQARSRILLVEDDPDVAELTGEMLRLLGHSVRRVADAEAALCAIGEGDGTDLVLTDVIMPGGKDGLDLAAEVLTRWPGLSVLLCSGYGSSPARVAEAGLPLLRKPFTLKQLEEAVCHASAQPRRAGALA